MPPLMGAGAFVMVELTGVPYTGIMAAALLPAVLFFLAVWVGIDAFSTRHPIKESVLADIGCGGGPTTAAIAAQLNAKADLRVKDFPKENVIARFP